MNVGAYMHPLVLFKADQISSQKSWSNLVWGINHLVVTACMPCFFLLKVVFTHSHTHPQIVWDSLVLAKDMSSTKINYFWNPAMVFWIYVVGNVAIRVMLSMENVICWCKFMLWNSIWISIVMILDSNLRYLFFSHSYWAN